MGAKLFRLKTMILVGICLISLAAPILSSDFVGAEAGLNQISWTDSPPITYSSVAVADMGSGFCPDSYQTRSIDGYFDLKQVCVKSSEFISFGVFYTGVSSNRAAAVSFKFDSKMHEVGGICEQYSECLYLPQTDTIVVQKRVGYGKYASLAVYKNFLSRLSQVNNGIDLTIKYDFDLSNPDFVFRNTDGTVWPVGSVGASNNGQWLAVEMGRSGVGLLNLDTLKIRRVSTDRFEYGMGMNPSVEFAVSNDGKTIVVMGMNAGLEVLGISPDCGEDLTDQNSVVIGYLQHPCLWSSINAYAFISSFANGYQPKFDDNGGELSFYAVSYAGEARQVVLRANGYTKPRLDYLALGDSFTSGEGESDDGYYQAGTNIEYEKCHLSSRSYPYVVAKWSNIDPTFVRSVACSGATTVDVVGNDNRYMGQGKRLGKDKMNLDSVNMVLSRYSALDQFIPGRVYQASFVEQYTPKVITIGIGGNDAGFMEVLKTCVGLGTCDAAGSAVGRDKVSLEIKGLFNTLVNTYQQIHKSSPDSKIYAIGYPNIIDPNGHCGPILSKLLDKTEREFVYEGITYLNRVISAAASFVGIKYIDIQDSYGDRVLCGDSQSGVMESMNAIALGDDSNMLNDSRWLRFIGSESFHPNASGHALVANTIMGTVGNIMDYSYCADGLVICPDQTVVPPEPSSYWAADGDYEYPNQHIADFVYDEDKNVSNMKKSIVFGPLSLAPLSSAAVDIYSNRVNLGNFYAAEDGSLNVSVVLPDDLEDGYHTVHLYGTSYSGEAVDLYQVIEINKLEPAVDIAVYNHNSGATVIGAAELISRNISIGKDMNEVIDIGNSQMPILKMGAQAQSFEINEGFMAGVANDQSLVKGASILYKQPSIVPLANANTSQDTAGWRLMFVVYVFLAVCFSAVFIKAISYFK